VRARKQNVLMALVVSLTLALLVASVVAQPEKADSRQWNEKFYRPLRQTLREIENRYVEEVDPGKLLIGAYQGILNSLDEYSMYIPPDRLEEFEGDTKGEFGGLGIQIRFLPEEKVLRVEAPIPGTPAFRLGVLAGDIITRVREESTGQVYETSKFKDIHEAVRILRGEPGTKVTIFVVHKGAQEEEPITITREIIKIHPIRPGRMVDEKWKVGYLYVPGFHERTAADLRKAIRELKKQGMKALVLDLRFDPGGLLNSAVEVADLLLPKGKPVVSVRGRSGPHFAFQARTGDLLDGAPLALLVNRHSASASEIVAGAIKDNGRGRIVGEKTYGKGSVQTIVHLAPGQGALKLTTARYYTPSGVCIEDKGVEPDVEVQLTDEQIRQLARQIARYVDRVQPEPQEPPQETAPAKPEPENADEGKSKGQFRDIQLEQAVEVLIAELSKKRKVAAEPVGAGAH